MGRFRATVCALLVLLILSACTPLIEQEEAKITVLCGSDFFYDDLKKLYNCLYSDVEVELVLFESGHEDRKYQFDRIRAEIMAGKGPDVLILPCENPGEDISVPPLLEYEPLITDVEGAMANNTFLPLDSFIANSEHIFKDNFIAPVWEACGNGEGQQVLPLAYTFDQLIISPNQVGVSDGITFTDEKLTGITDPELRAYLFKNAHLWYPSIYDYSIDNDTGYLKADEKELIEDLSYIADNISNLYSDVYLGEDCHISTDSMNRLVEGEGSLQAIYFSNGVGGIEAKITHYAAINRNTKYPDEAFRFIELLFSEWANDCTQYGPQSSDHFSESLSSTLSIYDCGIIADTSYWPEGWRERIGPINDHISSAKFNSEIESILYSLCHEISLGYAGEPESDTFTQYISNYYDKLRMIASE